MIKTYTVQYGSNNIDFELDYADRKTLGIKVCPDTSVCVVAPMQSSIEKVLEKVESKAAWILKQQDFFMQFHPKTPPLLFFNGETHLYLGRQYRLRVEKANTEEIKLSHGFIHIHTNKIEQEHLQKALNQWYQQKAEKHFRGLLKDVFPLFSRYNIPYPILDIRFMEKRWGSCSPKGKILLNTALIRAPKGCIRYVIIHELCHLIQPNHTKAFYRLLGQILPDFESWKDRLERVMV